MRSAANVRTDLPLAFLDAVLAALGYLGILVLRYEAAVPADTWPVFATFLPMALAAHLISNWAWGLYGRMWHHASIVEARRGVLAGATSTALVLFAYWVGFRGSGGNVDIPASLPVLGPIIVTMLFGAVRFQSRLFAFNRGRDRGPDPVLRLAVVGAGKTGAAIVAAMQRDEHTTFEPVAIFDDDPRKHRRALAGVPIVGTIDDLPAAAEVLVFDAVLLAIPTADADLVRRVADLAAAAGLALKVVPSVKEMVGGKPSVQDVRDLRIEDLLGRQQVDTDLDAVRAGLAGKRVLITGAGGSIGSEIARQVAMFEPGRLIMVDHDETHLHDAAAMVPPEAVKVLLDIRDSAAVERAFQRFRPEVVFHAAALKHVPVLEDHPCEAVNTNILGTDNLLAAAAGIGVERFVFISTDKAVRPSSVMGATKWLGEQLVLAQSLTSGGRYCAVRFGNVLGSRGSVIPTFTRQIATGGPVTVTDPRMTRFFMSVQEAVQLVLQAGAFADGGEVFMLEMGEPVSIVSLAEKMITLSGREVGKDVEIRYSGIRPGEKLAEELRAPTEEAFPTPHPSIVRLYPERFTGGELGATLKLLAKMAEDGREDEARRLIMGLPSLTFDLTDEDSRVGLFDELTNAVHERG